MSTEREVYHTELSRLGHGLPLYEPNPAGEYDEVRVGDVGYVDRFGRFHRMFNAFHEQDHLINARYGTPNGFIPMAANFRETFSRDAISPGSMQSIHVTAMGGDFRASGCIPSQAKISFSISNGQGAVVVIKYPAFRKDASYEPEMSKYMLKNYRSWLDFMRGRSVQLRDLVFVTGCDLTADWATATFVEKNTSCEISFKVGDGSIGAATASAWGTWESSICVPPRCGPGLVDPPHLSLLSVILGYLSIILGGFRVSEKLLIPRVIKAAAEPENMDMDREMDYAPALLSTEFDAEDIEYNIDDAGGDMIPYLPNKSYAPHNLVMDLLLEKSDADVVLVHDRDVHAFMNRVGDDIHAISGLNDVHLPNAQFTIVMDPTSQMKVGLYAHDQVETGAWNSGVAPSTAGISKEVDRIFLKKQFQHGDLDADPSNVKRSRIALQVGAPEFTPPWIRAKLRHLELPADSVRREAIVSDQGDFGNIFKGSCFLPLRGEVKVALKLLRFYLKEDIKKLFEQEIYVWSKLDHPNVLPLLGYYWEETGYPVLVSEWMDNGSAWSYTSSHPDCNLMHLVTGVAEGLAYLHEKGVIHSNINPFNIVITESGDARICGFTTSRFVDGSMNITGSSDEIRGTARYLAYELLAPSDSDTSHTKASDVWAFGMTIFALLTQQHPYTGLTDPQALMSILRRELPSLPPSDSGSPRRPGERILWNICLLCWDHDPEKRADMPSILRELWNHSDDTDVSRLVGDRDADP